MLADKPADKLPLLYPNTSVPHDKVGMTLLFRLGMWQIIAPRQLVFLELAVVTDRSRDRANAQI